MADHPALAGALLTDEWKKRTAMLMQATQALYLPADRDVEIVGEGSAHEPYCAPLGSLRIGQWPDATLLIVAHRPEDLERIASQAFKAADELREAIGAAGEAADAIRAAQGPIVAPETDRPATGTPEAPDAKVPADDFQIPNVAAEMGL